MSPLVREGQHTLPPLPRHREVAVGVWDEEEEHHYLARRRRAHHLPQPHVTWAQVQWTHGVTHSCMNFIPVRQDRSARSMRSPVGFPSRE